MYGSKAAGVLDGVGEEAESSHPHLLFSQERRDLGDRSRGLL